MESWNRDLALEERTVVFDLLSNSRTAEQTDDPAYYRCLDPDDFWELCRLYQSDLNLWVPDLKATDPPIPGRYAIYEDDRSVLTDARSFKEHFTALGEPDPTELERRVQTLVKQNGAPGLFIRDKDDPEMTFLCYREYFYTLWKGYGNPGRLDFVRECWSKDTVL